MPACGHSAASVWRTRIIVPSCPASWHKASQRPRCPGSRSVALRIVAPLVSPAWGGWALRSCASAAASYHSLMCVALAAGVLRETARLSHRSSSRGMLLCACRSSKYERCSRAPRVLIFWAAIISGKLLVVPSGVCRVCVCGCCAAPRLLHIVVRRCPEGISCDLLIFRRERQPPSGGRCRHHLEVLTALPHTEHGG